MTTGNMVKAFALAALCAGAAEVKVDWSAEIGPVKPVNGVGQPPMVGPLRSWPMFHYLKEAGKESSLRSKLAEKFRGVPELSGKSSASSRPAAKKPAPKKPAPKKPAPKKAPPKKPAAKKK